MSFWPRSINCFITRAVCRWGSLLLALASCAPDTIRHHRPDPRLAFSDLAWQHPALHSSSTPLAAYSTAGPTIVFLNFDGATIIKAQASDAFTNTSFLCGATIPAFDHLPFAAPRVQVINDLVTRVSRLYQGWSLEIVTQRPFAPPYEMVVVGGDSTLCGYPAGQAGVGPIDCDDQLPGEIALVFSATITHLDMLAIVIAHELAHSFGLLHTLEPCDVMSSFYCQAGEKQFLDQVLTIAPDHAALCNRTSQNAWQLLDERLGHSTPGSDLGPAQDAHLLYDSAANDLDVQQHSEPAEASVNDSSASPTADGCAMGGVRAPPCLVYCALLCVFLVRQGRRFRFPPRAFSCYHFLLWDCRKLLQQTRDVKRTEARYGYSR